MKLSILLPTRNRLEFLRYAIETVLRQEDGEWEIVVSDNDSEEDIAGHVAALGDPRIVYHRTDRFVPVTENWMAALERCSGDYVLMLGDDDGLMPGTVARVAELVREHGAPDVIYGSALLLTYPNVLSEEREGFLKPYGYASFLQGLQAPQMLDGSTAHEAARAAMDIRMTYGYNAQFVTVSRRLIDELAPQGAFYKSPFPDYYSTNVMFLTARSILLDPRPLTVIGVTPKSYGFYHANQREDEGRAFLAGGGEAPPDPELDRVLLPGTNINIGWLLAMEAIARDYGHRYGLTVNRARFRRLQAAHVYEQRYLHGTVEDAQLAELERRLSPRERRLYRSAFRAAAACAPLIPARLANSIEYVYRRSLRQYPTWDPPRIPGSFANVLEVFERYAQGSPTGGRAAR